MKAVTPILSHSSLLLIGLIAVSLIIVSLSTSFSTTESDLVRTELNYIVESAKSRILEVYNIASQQSEYFNSSFELGLPEKIGERKYLLKLDQENLTVSMSFKNENIEIVKTLNINAQMNGESYLPASILAENSGGIITIDLVG
jgi:cell shape-determining protein MreC